MRAHHRISVVDDGPRVGHGGVVIPREGVVPGARRPVDIAAEVQGRQTGARLPDVVRRQGRQRTAQRVTCVPDGLLTLCSGLLGARYASFRGSMLPSTSELQVTHFV